MTTFSHSFRIAAAAAALALLAIALLGLLAMRDGSRADAAAARAACANADAGANEATRKELRAAITCLIQRERARRDRPRLRKQRPLQRVAQRHTKVMLETGCFEHRCPGEAPLQKRIERSGYLEPGDRYGYAEVTGCSTRPKAMMEKWLGQRFHRRNLLKRSFRHVGVGVGKGAPEDSNCDSPVPYATYTVILAWRRS